MLTKNKVLNVIKGYAEEIGIYGVKRVGIFGSFVKANQTPKSDIDVLVEFARGTKRIEKYSNYIF